MPCILKERTPDSPGIVVFTHSEAIIGCLSRPGRGTDLLNENTRRGLWIYGVQIQADCSWLKEWPLAPWHSFIMWPNTSEPYLANVRDRILGMNCVNFMPDFPEMPPGFTRNVDLCIISRPSKIKRIEETLLTIRALMDLRPNLTVTLVVPDPRRIELGSDSYEIQHIEKKFYDLPLKLFSARELKQISFICTSEQSFGRFPLAQNVMTDLLSRSRFMYLASHKEGTPRVIAEALLTKTPCIVSQNLISAIRSCLNESNSVAVNDDPILAAEAIADALENYDRYEVNTEEAKRLFSEAVHKPPLKAWLSQKIGATGKPVNGRWFLEDLNMRMAGHGRRINLQYINDEAGLLQWMEKADTVRSGGALNPYDEDALFGFKDLNHPALENQPSFLDSMRVSAANALRKLLR